MQVPDQGVPGDDSVASAMRSAQEPASHPGAAERRLADLRAGNAYREKALAAQGVQLNEQAVIALQVRTLMRLVVGEDPARQLAYDLAYQESVAEGLGEIEADVRRRKLTGGLVVPGANGHRPG